MHENDTLGMTNGYPFPAPFQPQGKLQWRKKPLAKRGKSVIKKPMGKKPIVKKKK